MNDNNTYTPTPYMRKRAQGKRLSKQERQEIQEKFLDVFSQNANLSASCKEAGIDRTSVYYWQEHDEDFSMRFRIAEQEANDVIRAELFRRAVQGYEKPIVSMGKVVYVEEEDENGESIKKPLTERVYSDSLLSLLAKARMPEFREKQHVDLNTTTTPKDLQAMHDAIAQALEPFTEAKIAVAAALIEMEKSRGN